MGTLTKLSAKSLTVGVGMLAAASLSIGAAAAAPTSGDAAASAGGAKTAKGATNSSSRPTVTPAAKTAGTARFGVAATDNQALEAYWTPARMRAAVPVASSGDLSAKAGAWSTSQQLARQKGMRPVTNDGPLRKVAGAKSKVFTASGKGVTAAYNPNLPYYSPTAYTAGKVFFTKSDGRNYVCSGTIVNSEGKDSVWTAGHCVNEGSGGSWHSNWAFVPAYDDDLSNPSPYGTWGAAYLSSRSAWTGSSDFSQDIGVATMNTNFGWHIADYFGGQGITVNRGKSTYDYAFGYPAETPFDGGNLMRCQGWTSPEWDAVFFWSQTVKIPCDMTRGSSGGGWLNSYNGDWGYLNGVNSRIDRIAGPTIMLSPYFDDDAWSLYNYTRYN
ncbi:hypothetical protein BA895_06215 [Humibacillus sp. DSM 29435]|uniref:trypsin-like serine peptidase n=1 Tax=Humibacillus sp. DSM 29435 TaxID=1869167 RepID=UPI0008730438|nr:hypothetical protein [Humibacillus sp. DSM 29435]OFE15326.1 hypothetical protein BA895_06215 [Humibacillus sp. DSM 29435]